MAEILLKRVYETAVPEDGYRILVDRLWPRGISKERTHLDEWDKDLAPSTELREWFHHEPELWNEFSQKYLQELKERNLGPELMKRLKDQERITLVYGTKDEKHCHPIILRDYMLQCAV